MTVRLCGVHTFDSNLWRPISMDWSRRPTFFPERRIILTTMSFRKIARRLRSSAQKVRVKQNPRGGSADTSVACAAHVRPFPCCWRQIIRWSANASGHEIAIRSKTAGGSIAIFCKHGHRPASETAFRKLLKGETLGPVDWLEFLAV
jgi:hypothetical protein